MKNWLKKLKRYRLITDAYNFQHHGYYREAVKCFEKLWDLDLMDNESIRAHSICLYHLEKYEESIAVIEKTGQQETEDLDFLYMKSLCLLALNQKEAAFAVSKKILISNAQDENYLTNHASILGSMGKTHEAIDLYKRIISKAYLRAEISDDDPTVIDDIFHQSTNLTALHNLGFERLKIGEYEEAIENFNRVIELDSEFAYAYNNRGHAFLKLGNLSSALKDIDHSISLDPKNAYAYKNKALCLIALNNKEEALENLKTAKELGYTELYDNEVDDLINKLKNGGTPLID